MTDSTHSSEEIASIKARLDAIELAQKQAFAATLEGNRDAREMLEIFQAVKGGFKVLGWLATAAKWVGWLAGGAAAVYGLWQVMHGSVPPKT